MHRHLLPAFVLLLASAALVQDRFAEVEVTARPVAGNVWWIEGAGGNIAVSAGEDGVFVVDSQFLPLAERIEEAIDGVSEEPLRFLVNTHWHGDHTGGNPHFGEEAVIVAHDNVRRRLAGDAAIGGRVAETPVEGTPAELPVVTYENGVSIHLNGERIDLQHFPASHTDGDTVVWFRGSNVVHAGDLFFENQYPYVDVSSGGSTRGLVASVQRLVELVPEDAKVVPGHGEPTGRAGLVEYRDMLVDVVARVERALAEGKDAEAMLAEGLLDGHDERWGQGTFMTPERFLGIVAEDLAGE